MSIKNILLGLLILATGIITEANGQTKLSKKQRKLQEKEALADRNFIEGSKQLTLGDYKNAYAYLQKALELKPDEPAILYKMGELFARINEPEQALPYAEKAVELDPSNKYYALLVAEIYTNLKQPLKAAEILDQLTADGKSNQQYNLDLASIYLQAGEFDKALVVLNRAEAYFGILEPITQQKQRIYLRKNQLDEAIREGERLIENKPGNARYVLSLVEILYNNNRIDQAIELVNKEISKYPNQPELQLAAYTLLKAKGKKDESEVFLYKAFSSPDLEAESKARAFAGILEEIKTPEREKLLDSLTTLLIQSETENAAVFEVLGDREAKENQIKESVNWYKKSLDLNPKNARILEQVILNSFGENADLQGLEKYTILGVDEFPKGPEFWFYDGVVKSALKKDSVAVLSLQEALNLNQGQNTQLNQVAYGSLGSSLYNLGEIDSAFHYFDKALELNPNDEQVLNNYAYFLSLEKRDLEKAKQMAEKVVRKFPENGTFLDTYAWVLFQLGEYQEAYEYMEKALKFESEPSGTLLEHFGDILYHVGQKAEALSYWQKAAESSEASEKLPLKIRDKKYHE
ncbi:MAG: tetratricopeptide repeat protein [Algoriphagus sp.]|uniref:tetratricopeptide repeat protein n=1 Tax=Algoriphagus sp. TaxID=1872435 RepID=UPI001806E159|nr:tetratricopeptide repeat protein [Algoriphagus sp.]NVJ85169.1 tetratricopeptide repeat protein [Algoriphagus sp.]